MLKSLFELLEHLWSNFRGLFWWNRGVKRNLNNDLDLIPDPALQAGGHRFDPGHVHQNFLIESLNEHGSTCSRAKRSSEFVVCSPTKESNAWQPSGAKPRSYRFEIPQDASVV
jgi:hypothetical protein